MISTLGSQISRIALILYLFELERSAGLLALLVILETVPGTLAAPFAGALADRYSKRRLMIAADLARMAAVLMVCLQPAVGGICAAAVLLSLATSCFQPAKLATVPQVVRRHEVPQANGWIQSSGNLALIAGPIVGAQLFFQSGLIMTLLLDALSYLVSALLIMGLPQSRAGRQAKPRASHWAEIREGWAYMNRNFFILQMVMLFFVSLLCTGLWLPLAPFFIEEALNGPQHLLGWQVGVTGIGAVLGALWAPFWMRRFGKGRTLSGALVLEGAVMVLYSQVHHPTASLAIMVLWGLAVSGIMVPFYSILQTDISRRFQGRVFAVVTQSENLALVTAMGVAVLLQGAVPAATIFLFAGLAYCGLAMAGCLTPGGRLLLSTR